MSTGAGRRGRDRTSSRVPIITIRACALDLAQQARGASRQAGRGRRRRQGRLAACARPRRWSSAARRSSRPTRRTSPPRRARAGRRGHRPPAARRPPGRRDGPRAPRGRRPARPDRRDDRLEPAAQWAGRPPGPRPARRHLHDLREPAECHRRRRGALRQERQRRDPPRRQGGHRHQPGAAPHPGRPARPRAGCPSTPCSSCRRPTARPSASCWALPEYIDLAIPRGGEGLIRRVVAEATMPVLKHYQGNCHVYIDARCERRYGRSGSSSTPRSSARGSATRPRRCWSTATVAPHFLPRAAEALVGAGVELRGDPAARSFIPGMKPAEPDRLGYRVPRQDPGRRGGRVARRGHRAHRAARLGPHRGHRHRATWPRRAGSSPRSTARP